MSGKMKYQNIPYVDKPLSRVVYGTATAPMQANQDVFELLDAVFQAGINVFDTAALYQDAEASLGRWVKSRQLRDKVIILTKGANPNRYRNRLTVYDIMSDIEDSFAKLQTDYIDIYILHRDNPAVPVGPIVELLNKLHQEGRIGAFGGSNWTLERTKEANAYAAEHGLVPFTVCSPSYSLAECIGDPWGGSVTISGDKNREFRAWLQEQNMPIFTYSSLGRGFFSGRLTSGDADRAEELIGPGAGEYAFPINFEKLKRAEKMAADKNVSVSQIAFAWLTHQPLNIFAVTSPGSPKHIQETIDSLQLELTEQEMKWLNKEID